jgi:hypothetical protein
MRFWPVNEMTELVSGTPAPQFGDESSRVRGSELVQAVEHLTRIVSHSYIPHCPQCNADHASCKYWLMTHDVQRLLHGLTAVQSTRRKHNRFRWRCVVLGS